MGESSSQREPLKQGALGLLSLGCGVAKQQELSVHRVVLAYCLMPSSSQSRFHIFSPNIVTALQPCWSSFMSLVAFTF